MIDCEDDDLTRALAFWPKALGRAVVPSAETDGRYRATLRVTDVGGRDRGRMASAYVDVAVGGQAPVVTFVAPAEEQAQWQPTAQAVMNAIALK